MGKSLFSVVAFLLVVAGIVYLLLIHHLFARTPLLVAVQVAAALLMVWARKTFGMRSFHAAASPSEGELVTTGPYRYWRHPIYASILYFVWAGQVHAPTLAALAAAFLVTAALLARMLLEEQFLRARYPEYAEYSRHAKRILPFVA